MRLVLLPLVAALVVGCSSTASIYLKDQAEYRGTILGGDSERFALETEQGKRAVTRSQVAEISHPGGAAVAAGGALLGGGLLGLGYVGVSYRMSSSSVSAAEQSGAVGREYSDSVDDAYLATVAIIVAPVALTGLAVLVSGMAARTASEDRLADRENYLALANVPDISASPVPQQPVWVPGQGWVNGYPGPQPVWVPGQGWVAGYPAAPPVAPPAMSAP